jgi:hypothetical protein
MRRFVPVVLVAALALLLVAIPASARIDHHFSTLTRNVAFTGDRDRFHLNAQLFAGFNQNDQVGHLRLRCHSVASGKSRCAGFAKLNGEQGGFGFMALRGNIGHGDMRLNVTGGTDDFDGVAGKVTGHGRFLHFDLVG